MNTTPAKPAYRDMPLLNESMARQRDRVMAKVVHYEARGSFSYTVTTETGTQGVFYYLVCRDGSHVVQTAHSFVTKVAQEKGAAWLSQVAPLPTPSLYVTKITVRTWFQRTYGNTYHTVTLELANGTVHEGSVTYGCGDHWKKTATDLMLTLGVAFAGYWGDVEVTEVKRRKDL